jgi:hypothetical protein
MPGGYQTDPILRRIRAQARADLMELGDPALARSIFGEQIEGGRKTRMIPKAKRDDARERGWRRVKGKPGKFFKVFEDRLKLTEGERAFVKSIAANPYSTLKRIGHETELATEQLNEGLAAQGGYYTGYRGEQLGELERARQLQITDATRGASTGLRGILTNLARLQRDYNRTILGAEEAARQRQMLGY